MITLLQGPQTKSPFFAALQMLEVVPATQANLSTKPENMTEFVTNGGTQTSGKLYHFVQQEYEN